MHVWKIPAVEMETAQRPIPGSFAAVMLVPVVQSVIFVSTLHMPEIVHCVHVNSSIYYTLPCPGVSQTFIIENLESLFGELELRDSLAKWLNGYVDPSEYGARISTRVLNLIPQMSAISWSSNQDIIGFCCILRCLLAPGDPDLNISERIFHPQNKYRIRDS